MNVDLTVYVLLISTIVFVYILSFSVWTNASKFRKHCTIIQSNDKKKFCLVGLIYFWWKKLSIRFFFFNFLMKNYFLKYLFHVIFLRKTLVFKTKTSKVSFAVIQIKWEKEKKKITQTSPLALLAPTCPIIRAWSYRMPQTWDFSH